MKSNMKYWQSFVVIVGIVLCMAIAPVPIVTALAAGENKNTDFLHGKPFEHLQQQITNLDSRITDIEQDEDELDEEEVLLLLQQQVSTLNDSVLALQAKMSAVQGQIQVLQQDAQANKLVIESLQTHLTGLQSQLSTVQNQLTTKLTELQGQITLLQQNISEAISQSNSSTADLSARIALLERKTQVHPSLAALVAGAYCQAMNAPTNYMIYSVSREWSTDGSCESACWNWAQQRGFLGLGHYTGHGIGDLGCTFHFDAEGRITSVAGRPDSGYVEADTPYCDWCCCVMN